MGGHGRALLGKELDTPNCHCLACQATPVAEDVDHVLGTCPQWEEQRAPLTKLLTERGTRWQDLPDLFRHTGVVTKEMLSPAQHENGRFFSFLRLCGPKGCLGVREGHPAPQLRAGVP